MRRLRPILAAFAALLAVLATGGSARADDGSTLSAITRAADGSVSGVLTVPSAQGGAGVDLGSLVFSLGGKDFPVKTQPVSTVERTAIILIDRSGSMGASGMATVRASVAQFIATVPKDVKVGVVSFADQANLDVAPTLDRGAVQAAANGLKADGDTRLYDAVMLAVKTLGATGDRSIVLLSDGKDTVSTTPQAETEGTLQGSGVRMQVIAFRTGFQDDLALGYLAAAGQGQVTAVGDNAGVTQAFAAAGRALDSQVSWSAAPQPAVYGKQSFSLKGVVNGAPFAASGAADFGAAPAPTTPATAAPAPSPSAVAAPAPVAAPQDDSAINGLVTGRLLGVPLPIAIASAALFAGLLLLVMALASPVFKSRKRERVESIEQYVTQTGRRAADTVRTTSVSGIAEHLVQMGDKAVEGRESTPETVKLLQRADLPWRPGEWAVLRVIALVVCALLGFLLLHGSAIAGFFGILAGVVAGLILPPFVLKFLAARRAKKFEQQLPDVLTLVASSLSTGFSLPQALDAVSHDVAQPAAKEFSRAMAETRIGADVEEALERMAERMDSKNMKWAAMAIQIQRKVGGNLAETLRTTATTLREREALFRQVRALSAEGRLSAYILIALPIVIFLWMLYVNGEYISLLWKSVLGLAMVFVTLVLMGIGIFWMNKVVEVKV